MFDLQTMNDDECNAEFRFLKQDIYTLADVLQLPNTITTYNGLVVQSIPALCMLLKRFAYPCRYGDLIPRFARPVPELSIIINHIMDLIYNRWHHLIDTFNHRLLSPVNLQVYAQVIANNGAPLENCWGFVDGTVRPICRPNENQRVVYNGHKKVHSLKYQAVVLPNGLIANMFGPVEGRRHDSGILAASGLLTDLQTYAYSPNGDPMCIYGDLAYPLRIHLQTPFQTGPRQTQQQRAFNQAMSSVRVSVEWVFGDIVNYFKFIDFKKDLKVGLSAVGKMYLICALLHNARCCLYKSNTSDYFGLDPPVLADYFV